jgi:hypothetical protein
MHKSGRAGAMSTESKSRNRHQPPWSTHARSRHEDGTLNGGTAKESVSEIGKFARRVRFRSLCSSHATLVRLREHCQSLRSAICAGNRSSTRDRSCALRGIGFRAGGKPRVSAQENRRLSSLRPPHRCALQYLRDV